MDHVLSQRLTSLGLLLAIASGVIAIGASGRALVSGPARVGGTTLVIGLPTETLIVFTAAAAALVALLLITGTWAKLVGVGLAFALAGTEAFMVTIAKTSTRFHANAAVHLETGGKILAAAFIVGIAGVVTMIVGARELVPDDADAPEHVDAAGLPARPGSASVAFGFSLLGVIFFPVAPVGVNLGLIAYGELTRARDYVPGRNLILTAIVIGTAWTSLWIVLVFATGIFSSHPL